MNLNWRAIGYGFLATVILGVLSGATLPYTDFTMPTVSYGLTGLIGGAIAGYVTMGTAGDGALNGFLATIIGGLVVLAVLAVIGTLVAGLLGLGIVLFAVFLLALAGIPGAVGGYLGAWYRGRRSTRRVGRTA